MRSDLWPLIEQPGNKPFLRMLWLAMRVVPWQRNSDQFRGSFLQDIMDGGGTPVAFSCSVKECPANARTCVQWKLGGQDISLR